MITVTLYRTVQAQVPEQPAVRSTMVDSKDAGPYVAKAPVRTYRPASDQLAAQPASASDDESTLSALYHSVHEDSQEPGFAEAGLRHLSVQPVQTTTQSREATTLQTIRALPGIMPTQQEWFEALRAEGRSVPLQSFASENSPTLQHHMQQVVQELRQGCSWQGVPDQTEFQQMVDDLLPPESQFQAGACHKRADVWDQWCAATEQINPSAAWSQPGRTAEWS